MPSTVLDPGRERIAPLSLSGIGLSLTPPTRYPHGWGQVLWMGIASVAAGTSPAVTCQCDFERAGRLFNPLMILEDLRAWD